MSLAPVLLAAALAATQPAAAARTPEQRQTLVDLAYVLGEAHALRAACRGADDQSWRARMTRMIEVEKPDTAFRRRLIDSFNAGFVTRQAATPSCGEATPAQERDVASRGRDLAQRLAGRP
jgi:uncharacterized protein (TIGR02301 family)